MANAMAILFIETAPPIMMQCAVGTTIAKGQCLKLTDAFTAIATSAGDDECAGICAREKIADDGKKSVAVWREGYFKVEAGSTGASVGLPQKIEANNEFTDTAANNSDLGYNWGVAMETAANGETFILHLNPGV